MTEFILANDQRVTVDQGEINKIITGVLIPNPYWRYSGLLQEAEVMAYLQGRSDAGALERIAYYILVYCECTAFSAYLFGKADGTAEESLEFNEPTLEKLRQLYQDCRHTSLQEGKPGIVHQMESAAMEIGADPL